MQKMPEISIDISKVAQKLQSSIVSLRCSFIHINVLSKILKRHYRKTANKSPWLLLEHLT